MEQNTRFFPVMTIVVIVAMGLFALVAYAVPVSLTEEDFSDITFYDANSTDLYSLWDGGARLQYNTGFTLPAPYVHKPTTSAILQGVAVKGDYIYTTKWLSNIAGVLYILNTNTNSFSTLDISTEVNGYIRKLVANDSTLFIVWEGTNTTNAGITMVNISSAGSPVLQGTLTLADVDNLALDPTSGDYYYALTNGSTPMLYVLGIVEGAPFVYGSVNLPGGVTYSNLIKHPYEDTDIVMVSARGGDNAVVPVDVSNVTAPSVTSMTDDTITMNIVRDMHQIDDNLYLFVGTNDSNEEVAQYYRIFVGTSVLFLEEYAFSGQVPERIETGDTSGLDVETYISSSITGTANRRIDVFDMDVVTPTLTPDDIVLQESVDIATTWDGHMAFAELNAATNSDDRLYFSDFRYGLIELNITDPDEPWTDIPQVSTTGSYADVVTVGNTAYAIDAGDQTIDIIGVSDPSSGLSVSNTISTAGCGSGERIHYNATDDMLYGPCGTAYYLAEIVDGPPAAVDVVSVGSTVLDAYYVNTMYSYVITASGLSVFRNDNAGQVGSTIGDIGTPTSIIGDGSTYVYVISSNGIHVFDISTPASPSLVRSFNPVGTSKDADIDGSYLYLVGNQLRSIPLSELNDPNNDDPTVNSFNVSVGERIEVNDGYAYLGNNAQALETFQLIDVSDPENMSEIALKSNLSDGDLGGGFAFTDGWVFIADGDNFNVIHMLYSYNNNVRSLTLDTVATEIISTDFEFTLEANSGVVNIYLSNTGGSFWEFAGSTNSSGTVSGTHNFSSSGSDLRWRFLLRSDASTFNQTPVVSNVSLQYLFNDTFVTDTTAPTVNATPAGGTYPGPQTVRLAASEAGATIYYTTDGSTPTSSSATYDPNTPLQLISTTTLKVIAVDSSNNAGAVATHTYTLLSTIDTTAPSSMVDLGSFVGNDGPFSAAFNVELVCEDNMDYGPQIRYTTDGSTPTSSSTLYTAPISITTDTTVQFYCIDAAGNAEASINSEVYEFGEELVEDTTAPTSMISPDPGTYPSATTITISTSDDYDSTPLVYYTFDSTTPGPSNGFVYVGSFTINTDVTIRLRAIDASGNAEAVQEATYSIGTVDEDLVEDPPEMGEDPTMDPRYEVDTENPTLGVSPAAGTFDTPQTVQYTCEDALDPNPAIYWSLTDTVTSREFREPIVVDTTTTLRALCRDASGNESEELVGTYTITNDVTDTAAPTVVSNCPVNGYFGEFRMTLEADDDSDAEPAIYFTLDGTAPLRKAAFTYSGEFTLTSAVTLKYFAQDASGNASEVQTAECNIYDPDALSLVAKNKKTGVGKVRIVNKKNNQVLSTFRAFTNGGVRAEIVQVRGVKRVAAIQYKKSNLLKIFDLNGNLLGKKKFRNNKAAQQIKAGNLYKGAANEEIVVTELNTKAKQFVVRAFTVNNSNIPRQRAKKTITSGIEKLLVKGYRLQINKKKLLVKTPKGKKALLKLELVKKNGKYGFTD